MSFQNEIKEEIIEAKENLKELEKQSLAYEMLKDQRKQNKRLFIIWIITFVAFIGLLGYTIYLLNDITVVENTEESYNMSTEDGNNNFIGGDNNGEINNN